MASTAADNLNENLLNEDSQPAQNLQAKDTTQPGVQPGEGAQLGEGAPLDEVSRSPEVLQSDEKISLGEVLQLSAPAEEVLSARPDALHYLTESYRALYIEEQVLTQPVRHALATIAARRQGSVVLAQHHGALADPALIGEELPQDLKLEAIIEHVDLITVSPGLVEPEDQYTLQLAGVTPEEIVLLSQIVAYTSTLVRVIDGYALLAGETTGSDTSTPDVGRAPEVSTLLASESDRVGTPPDSIPRDPADSVAASASAAPLASSSVSADHLDILDPTTPLARPTVAAGRTPAPKVRTARGSLIPTEFTTEVLDWEPWVAPPAIEELTEAQLDSFASKAAANSEYFRLLALLPNVLKARSALDNAIFLGENGLPRGERELAAAVTSKVNGCIFCASVHARKAAFQTKRPEDVDRLLAVSLTRDENWLPVEAERLAEGQDERWNALILFEARLSQLIPRTTAADVERLTAVGLTPEQIGDTILSVAFFSWANRLMLSLGEPAIPGTGLAL